ncbi:AAA+ ATPase domain [Macleaya cordata]|uniref:AAA+ ATPase domain n=1 Tax=Macleaya cordata TaxID=56857 RepID=A0A200RD59_MACCD|nr:AAA+ ATPase domain [Macleaya cordata]
MAQREKSLVRELILSVASAGFFALMAAATLRYLDPNRDASKKALKLKKQIATRLGRPLVDTNSYEDMIACDVINPDSIEVEFESIGGLEKVKEALHELVILPLQRPELFAEGKLLGPQKGVLLYGPPGTGKTMLAKAIAKESGAVFINVKVSNLMSKWFGDAQKLVAAIFSLAEKLQPAIIFIDEVDSFLGQRRSSEHESLTSMKTEFMASWDGLTTDQDAQVMVLAATNRPSDLDEAILRRLPQAFEIGIPNRSERAKILKVILKGEKVEENIDCDHIASLCEDYSGSDLLELCKQAAYLPIRDLLKDEMDGKHSNVSIHLLFVDFLYLMTPQDVIACDVINPDHIDVEFDSIGGLEKVKQALYELVILPLRRPELFAGKLLSPQKGVLLYGPPGTGKTMLAKAIAKESGAVFINVRISNLMSKWFGDAQKLVAAVFSLAYKLQPAIIFIDEVDSFLGQRRTTDHEAMTNMKTEFMALWDGFTTDQNARVMVLAATNRPSELDEAILRRLPQAFEIGIPDRSERVKILKVILKGEKVEEDIDYDHIANLCEGYTGSDLLELCKQAAYFPVRDLLRDEKDGKQSNTPRPLSQADLEKVLATSRKTRVVAGEYSRTWSRNREDDDYQVQDAISGLSKLVLSQIMNLRPEAQDP